jgi:hypothetical protein
MLSVLIFPALSLAILRRDVRNADVRDP